jgi:Ni,Fe-hydrogenase I cytochrome b subunit
MQFPLSFSDIILWLAITAIILLATSELISPYYGKTNLLIDKNRLRLAALGVGIVFIVTILVQIYLMTPF